MFVQPHPQNFYGFFGQITPSLSSRQPIGMTGIVLRFKRLHFFLLLFLFFTWYTDNKKLKIWLFPLLDRDSRVRERDLPRNWTSFQFLFFFLDSGVLTFQLFSFCQNWHKINFQSVVQIGKEKEKRKKRFSLILVLAIYSRRIWKRRKGMILVENISHKWM